MSNSQNRSGNFFVCSWILRFDCIISEINLDKPKRISALNDNWPESSCLKIFRSEHVSMSMKTFLEIQTQQEKNRHFHFECNYFVSEHNHKSHSTRKTMFFNVDRITLIKTCSRTLFYIIQPIEMAQNIAYIRINLNQSVGDPHCSSSTKNIVMWMDAVLWVGRSLDGTNSQNYSSTISFQSISAIRTTHKTASTRMTVDWTWKKHNFHLI